MPVMDGWELLLEMAKDPALADIPVLVLLGEKGRQGSRDEGAPLPGAGKAGVRVLPKPVNFAELLAFVRRCSA